MFTEDNLNKERLYYYLLDRLKIPVDSWGQGAAKTFDSLVSEIEKGECSVDQTGVRKTRVVLVDVISEHVRLVEERQVFSDGRERERKLPFGSLGEKMFTSENAFTALNRMFKEEVKVDLFKNCKHFKLEGPVYKLNHRASSSYPGLQNLAEEFQFTTFIDEYIKKLLGENEVISVEENKTTFFKWEDIRF